MVTVEQKISHRPPVITVKVTLRSHNKVPEYCLLSEERNPVERNRQQILVCVQPPTTHTHTQTAGSAEALSSPLLLTATDSFSLPVCIMNHATAYISLLEASSSEVTFLTISPYFKSITVKVIYNCSFHLCETCRHLSLQSEASTKSKLINIHLVTYFY